MKLSKLYIIVTLIILVQVTLANNVDNDFKRANTYYQNKQYTEAANTYIRLVNTPIKDAALYYNLANCYFQLKQYPNAILFYEKALLYDGNNKSIHHNLKLAQNKALTKIETDSRFFVIKAMETFFKQQQQNFWSRLFLISFIIFAISLSIQFINKNKIGKIAATIAMLFFVLSIVLFATATAFNQLQNKHEFAIVMKKTQAHSKPSAKSILNLTIEAGNKIKLLDKDANWIKVQLPNGKTTWLDKTTVKTI